MFQEEYGLVNVSAWQVKGIKAPVGGHQAISIYTWSFSLIRCFDWTAKICTQCLPSLRGRRLWELMCPCPPWEGQCMSKFLLAPRLVVKFG
jgi:hypothetical protein